MEERAVRKLPESVWMRIAAGEVVEGPESIVKELVENSIDAGSTSIEIYLEGGGKDRIVVLDNGSGMSKDDAVLAFENHATSKISSFEDIFSLGTLGFRGEALHSISLSSRVEMITRRKDKEVATRLLVEFGELKAVEDVGFQPGTRVSVWDIFGNAPARREFLKKKRSVLREIKNIVLRFSLSFPEISFSLYHQGSVVFKLPGEDLMGRLKRIYGPSMVERLLSFSLKKEGYKIDCFLSDQSLSFKDAERHFFFVNRRPFLDRFLVYHLRRLTHRFYPRGRSPLLLLFIEADPGWVDVNIHPRKMEVRFKDRELIASMLEEGIKSILGGEASFISSPRIPYKTPERLPKRSFKLVGSFKSYLFLEEGDSLYIVHKKRALERVVYDAFVEELGGEGMPLSEPLEVELDPDTVKEMKLLGFIFEDGLLKAVPMVMGRFPVDARKLIDGIRDRGFASLKEAISLSAAEAADPEAVDDERFLDIMELIDEEAFCPHGMPVMVKVSDMDKLFKLLCRDS